MIISAFRRIASFRMVGVLAGALMIIIGTAPAASAHVQVSGTNATPGGYGLLTFQVPAESDEASTTEVIINFPRDTPIVSVSVAPVAGWEATVHTARLGRPVTTDDGQIDEYVTKVDWKADSARTAIEPGQFGLFNISAGPLPRTSKITFPTEQRYSDGTVVAWDQVSTGSAEPDHLAPALRLASEPASPERADSGPAVAGDGAGTPPGDPPGDLLGIIAIGLAAVAVVTAAIALLRTRRPTG